MDNSTIQELIDLGYINRCLTWTFLILSYIAVSLRLWVRFRITKNPGWDDAAMVGTLVLFTAYCSILITLGVRIGSGKYYSIEGFRLTLLFIQLKEVFYTATTILLKISLGLFFLRILTKRWQSRTFKVIIAVSVVYGLFFFFIILFQCGDPKHLADRLLTQHKCLPVAVVLGTGYGYGTINVISDWTFVLIPIAILLDSDLDRRSKISVSIVMAFGTVGSIASIFRMVFLRGTLIGYGSLSPVAVKVQIWTTAEPGMGIIASSIAILRPLLRKLSSEIQTTMSKSRRGSETAVDNKNANKPHTRKISLPMHKKDVQPDQIALTARSPIGEAHNAIRSPRSLDPWSPTAQESHAFPQRVTSVGMFNYKEGFGPSRV